MSEGTSGLLSVNTGHLLFTSEEVTVVDATDQVWLVTGWGSGESKLGLELCHRLRGIRMKYREHATTGNIASMSFFFVSWLALLICL